MTNQLQEQISFSDWKCSASQSGKLNTNPQGGTPMDAYLKAISEISELNLKAKRTDKQEEKLKNLNSELPNLKNNKDKVVLSKTTQSFLKEIYWSTRVGVKKDIFSDYMENGTMAEEDAIKLISELDDPELFEMGTQLYEKCKLPRQYNNHFSGECDIKHSPTIQDTKCCWDIFSYFPHVDELCGEGGENFIWNEVDKIWESNASIENDTYDCQGQVYLELYGEEIFLLRYCLVNMPQSLLEQQFRYILRDLGASKEESLSEELKNVYRESIVEFERKHKFDHLPIESRVVTFKVKRDTEKYISLCKKVENARIWLNEYSKQMFLFERPDLRENKNIIINNIDLILNNSSNSERFEIETLQEKSLEEENKYFDLMVDISDSNNEVISDSNNKVISDSNNEVIIDAEFEEVNSYEKDENFFPDSLDSIEPSEPSEPSELNNTTSDNPFIQSILNLKTIDDCIVFMQENSDELSENLSYEDAFYAKRDEIFSQKEKIEEIESKKVSESKKTKETKNPNLVINQTKVTEPEIKYTGNETYDISDGLKIIVNDLKFEDAKKVVLDCINEILKSCERPQDIQPKFTNFCISNRELINRDKDFKLTLENLGKQKVKELVEIIRKKTLDEINPSRM